MTVATYVRFTHSFRVFLIVGMSIFYLDYSNNASTQDKNTVVEIKVVVGFIT